MRLMITATKFCTLFLLLGTVTVLLSSLVLAQCVSNDPEDGGGTVATMEYDYVVVIDQENGVNDSTECFPSMPGIPANFSCWDINLAFRFRKNSTKFVLVPGNVPHYLGNDTLFFNYTDLAFVGNGSIHSTVECAEQAGMTFLNSTNIVLENIHFRLCGATHNSTSMDFIHTTPPQFQPSLVSLFFNNCSDVTMYKVAVNESRNATGVIMYDTVGLNNISKCCFYNNSVNRSQNSPYAGGGGFAVEFTFCQLEDTECLRHPSTYRNSYRRNQGARYVFDRCVFQENVAYAQTLLLNNTMDKFVALNHNESHELFGRGGGIVIYFKGEAKNNKIEIQNCNFTENVAVWGGGIAVSYKDNPEGNEVRIENCHFVHNKCFKTLDYDTGGGAILIASSLQNSRWGNHISSNTNHVAITHSEFRNNFCVHGGGINYFLKLQLDIAAVTMHVAHCTFVSNSGRLGSAVKVSPYLVYNSTSPSITFTNCTFENNSEIDFIYGSSYYKIGLGTVYIYNVFVIFDSDILFLHNTGSSALGVANTDIDCRRANMTFIGNNGTDGGGIALVGAAAVLIGAETKMTFKDNHVSRYGGAIYSQYIGRELMKASVRCFMQYDDPFCHPNDWNSSFTFQNNNASKLGNSIYATSVFPCSWFNKTIRYVFCSNDNWHFKKKDGSLADCPKEIYTEPYTFNISNSSALPGKGFWLNIATQDDLNHDVTQDTVYNAYTNPNRLGIAQVDPRYTDITSNYVTLSGKGNQNVSLELETANSRLDHIHVHVELLQCPPGLIPYSHPYGSHHNLIFSCKCRSEFTFVGNLRCSNDTFSAQVIGFSWIGTLPDDVDNETLYMGPFPAEFYHYIGNESGMLLLPNKTEDLDESVCGRSNRTGILCGKCKDGYATAVNSLSFECIPCQRNETNFGLNILKYLSLTFIPYVIFFGVIIFFNFKLTGSSANSFILFAQLVSAGIFPIDGNKLAYLSIGKRLAVTQEVYTVVYGLFNLNSFSIVLKPFCVSTTFTTLDVLCLDYVIAAFPLVVIIFIRVLVSLKSRCKWTRCTIQRKTKITRGVPQLETKQSPKWSLLNAFVAFVFLSYTKFSLASMRILNSTRLFNENGTYYGPRRMFYAGHHTFTSSGFFFPYGFITLLVFIFFVLCPPILLMGPIQLIDWLLDKAKFAAFRKYWPSITIHAYLDAAFFGYKLNRRIFAGLYLLFRLAIFINYSFNTSQTTRLLVQQILCSIMLLLVAVFQPHKKAFFNFVDILILFSFVILNSLSVYISIVQLENAYESFPIGVYIFEYILVWIPLVYMVVYLLWKYGLKNMSCYESVKKKLRKTLKLFVNIEDPEDEENHPLLRPTADPGSFGYEDETDGNLTDDEMFRRAEGRNCYNPQTETETIAPNGSDGTAGPTQTQPTDTRGTTRTTSSNCTSGTRGSDSSPFPLESTTTTNGSGESTANNRSNTSTY